MNDSGSERSKAWNMYTSREPIGQEAPWKSNSSSSSSFGTSMNAISFGFVATAILISMFLIMAIFEHLFRPQQVSNRSLESGQAHKPLNHPQRVSSSYSSDISVVMPGQKYPSFIAQPAPLPCPRETISWPFHDLAQPTPLPCPRETISWPLHDHSFAYS